MNKYLKLFETKDAFRSCLEAKIGGDNTAMGFPNVSVIGAEDNNGNFSASEVHYIKDLNKAQAIRQALPLNSSHWVNPTTVNVISDQHTIKSIRGSIESGPSMHAIIFQPYDWYDENTDTTYYAFISWDAFMNITNNHKGHSINLLDGETVGMDLVGGVGGYPPRSYIFSNFNQYDSEPKFSGIILYLKDLSEINEEDIYQREFSIDDNGTLTFGDIEPFTYRAATSFYFEDDFIGRAIEGYTGSGSGSGSGSGN